MNDTPEVAVRSAPPVGRDLARVGAATAAVLASSVAMVAYVPFVLDQRSEFNLTVPYAGWQVVVVDVVFAVALLTIGFVSAALLRRTYRRLRGRTPHRRLAALLAILPGLFIGALLMAPAAPIVTWASNHTAQAAHWRAIARRAEVAYRKAPPAVDTGAPVAPSSVATRLLTVQALGPGWFEMQRPNPSSLPLSLARAPGNTLRVHSVLSRQHWSGTGWRDDTFVSETLTRFASRSDAVAYLVSWKQPDTACGCSSICGCRSPSSTVALPPALGTRRLDGAIVFERARRYGSDLTYDAAFRVGADVVTLIVMIQDQPATAADQYRSLLGRAVQRATAKF